ncbi:MAG: sterol desaturase family protein [Deltaproteobacteria bacterium]|nr:sterol desaturase family protein [Deltaproteobacteria bacterium]
MSLILRQIEALSETKLNYRLGFVVDSICGILLLGVGVSSHGGEPVFILVSVVLGYLYLTFLEYCIHRILFHWGPPNLFNSGHQKHHDDPKVLLALPFVFGVSLTAAHYYAFGWLFPGVDPTIFLGTLLFGYFVYGVVHHAQHYFTFHNRLWLRLLNHHTLHHVYPDKNYGVTTTLWDHVFFTYQKSLPTRANHQGAL